MGLLRLVDGSHVQRDVVAREATTRLQVELVVVLRARENSARFDLAEAGQVGLQVRAVG